MTKLAELVNSPSKIKLVSTGIFALLTISLAWNLLSWIYMPGIVEQDASLAFQAPYTPMFKYFVWAAVFFYVAVISFLQWKLKLLGGLNLMFALWLTISALYRYYSVLNLELTTVVAVVIEVVSIVLYIMTLFEQSPAKRAN
jgi:hypothetical protein